MLTYQVYSQHSMLLIERTDISIYLNILSQCVVSVPSSLPSAITISFPAMCLARASMMVSDVPPLKDICVSFPLRYT